MPMISLCSRDLSEQAYIESEVKLEMAVYIRPYLFAVSSLLQHYQFAQYCLILKILQPRITRLGLTWIFGRGYLWFTPTIWIYPGR